MTPKAHISLPVTLTYDGGDQFFPFYFRPMFLTNYKLDLAEFSATEISYYLRNALPI